MNLKIAIACTAIMGLILVLLVASLSKQPKQNSSDDQVESSTSQRSAVKGGVLKDPVTNESSDEQSMLEQLDDSGIASVEIESGFESSVSSNTAEDTKNSYESIVNPQYSDKTLESNDESAKDSKVSIPEPADSTIDPITPKMLEAFPTMESPLLVQDGMQHSDTEETPGFNQLPSYDSIYVGTVTSLDEDTLVVAGYEDIVWAESVKSFKISEMDRLGCSAGDLVYVVYSTAVDEVKEVVALETTSIVRLAVASLSAGSSVVIKGIDLGSNQEVEIRVSADTIIAVSGNFYEGQRVCAITVDGVAIFVGDAV